MLGVDWLMKILVSLFSTLIGFWFPGRAGRDYPILSYIPLTSFGCDLVADYPGYYADMEAGCQVRKDGAVSILTSLQDLS